jgi:hypothetical protein
MYEICKTEWKCWNMQNMQSKINVNKNDLNQGQFSLDFKKINPLHVCICI